MPPAPPPPRLDPAIIERAPIEPESGVYEVVDEDFLNTVIGDLSEQNEVLAAELAALKGRKTFDDVRADMMQPYANKVFNFLVGYCVFVAAVILLNGFHLFGFAVSDVVLGVISGSTAVAAIGLVGFVVSGLFGVKAKEG